MVHKSFFFKLQQQNRKTIIRVAFGMENWDKKFFLQSFNLIPFSSEKNIPIFHDKMEVRDGFRSRQPFIA